VAFGGQGVPPGCDGLAVRCRGGGCIRKKASQRTSVLFNGSRAVLPMNKPGLVCGENGFAAHNCSSFCAMVDTLYYAAKEASVAVSQKDFLQKNSGALALKAMPHHDPGCRGRLTHCRLSQ